MTADSQDLMRARINHRLYGEEGPRVLLLHPIGFDLHTWDDVLPYIEDGYRIAAIDLPGHGQSDKPAGVDYGLRLLGQRLIRFLDELGWEDAVLVGNSIGGGTCLSAAAQAPERVTGLALFNTIGFREGLPLLGRIGRVPGAPSIAGWVPVPLVRLGLDYACAGWGKVTTERAGRCAEYLRDPEGRAAFFRMLRQIYGPDLDWLAAHYNEVRCPTLIAHGEADPLVPISHAKRMASAIPSAKFARIRGSGHFPQEERPEIVGPMLRRFVEKVGSARPR